MVGNVNAKTWERPVFGKVGVRDKMMEDHTPDKKPDRSYYYYPDLSLSITVT